MKKITICAALLTCLLFLFPASACGKTEESVAGVYQLSRLQYAENNEVVTINTGERLDDVILTEDFVVLWLREDGTARLTITSGEGVSDASEGRWKIVVGKKVEISAGGVTQTVNMEWDRFTFKMDKYTVTFIKRGSFAGVYRLSCLQYALNGIVFTVHAGEEFNGKTLEKDFMTIELYDDGTLKLTITNEVTDVARGTWEINSSDNRCVDISLSGSLQTVRMEESGFLMKIDSWTITFERE